jgi:hypothetical protein
VIGIRRYAASNRMHSGGARKRNPLLVVLRVFHEVLIRLSTARSSPYADRGGKARVESSRSRLSKCLQIAKCCVVGMDAKSCSEMRRLLAAFPLAGSCADEHAANQEGVRALAPRPDGAGTSLNVELPVEVPPPLQTKETACVSTSARSYEDVEGYPSRSRCCLIMVCLADPHWRDGFRAARQHPVAPGRRRGAIWQRG